jgi:hypothetical protein
MRHVGGHIECSYTAMGGDPLVGVHKMCVCYNLHLHAIAVEKAEAAKVVAAEVAAASTALNVKYTDHLELYAEAASICAYNEGEQCECVGQVFYGYKTPNAGVGTLDEVLKRPHKMRHVGGHIECSYTAMGGDPLVGIYKMCMCYSDDKADFIKAKIHDYTVAVKVANVEAMAQASGLAAGASGAVMAAELASAAGKFKVDAAVALPSYVTATIKSPPILMGYDAHTMIKGDVGGEGSYTSCNARAGGMAARDTAHTKSNGCLWDDANCFDMYGQCAMYEDEVEEKCGGWNKCQAVVCRADYQKNGKQVCLARDIFVAGAKMATMWAWHKEAAAEAKATAESGTIVGGTGCKLTTLVKTKAVLDALKVGVHSYVYSNSV